MKEVKPLDLISETEAAVIVGLHKARRFYDTFVKNKKISPVVFPGKKRRLYFEHEVRSAVEKCRVRETR